MSEQYRVVYTPEARDDLKAIYRYIAVQFSAPETAREQVNRIRAAVRSLNVLPFRHPRVEWEPWASMGMCKVPADRYVVYYLPERETRTVTIVRIFYGGRDVREIVQQGE